jgi:ABC-2 type transport system permease protein
MISSLLKILDLFRPLYLWQGINYAQVRAIVGIKLETDNRRTSPLRPNQKVEEPGASFAWSLAVYFFFGAMISIMLLFVPSLIFAYTIYHAYLMVMLVMMLISDFSAVLLDTSDNTIVLPRPITPKTFYAARSTHILLYIGLIGLALSIAPIAVTFYAYGSAVGLSLVVTTVLSIVFSVAITHGLYLILMRLTSEERLKNLINYFQIIMTLMVIGGYQLLPRLLGQSFMDNTSAEFQWWSVFVPPMWMAAVNQWATSFELNAIVITNVVLAFTMPVAAWKIINQYLVPYFIRKLADLGTSSSTTKRIQIVVERPRRFSLSRFVAQEGLERATYTAVSALISRDRKLKLRVYPSLGTFVILAIVFLSKSGKDAASLTEYFQKLGDSQMHLTVIYLCILVVVTASFEIYFSDEYKSAWVFQSAPIKRPGKIVLGTIKAMLARYFFPLYAGASVFVLMVWGIKATPDLLLGLLLSYLITLSLGIIGDKFLPMSQPINARTQGASVARAFIAIFFISAVGFGHHFLTNIDYGVLIAIPVVVGLIIVVQIKMLNLKWSQIGSV